MANSIETALVEAVRRKRRQLDEEIEVFRGLKEREFRAFEGRLRMLGGSAGGMGSGGEVDVGVEVARVEAELRGGRARIKVGKRGRGMEREREREFEGVFTPRFLPLLGGKGKEGGLVGGGEDGERGFVGEEGRRDEAAAAARREEEREEAKKEILAARRGVQPMLSCSAEYRRSGMTSPPARPTRPLSSSVPPERALDHRRSSSRSDASIDGLRSSLRSSREPRSPKRVQFSIDDTVVSPSTSPVATRCDEAVYRNPTSPTKGAKGFERFEVLKGQRTGKTSSNGIEGHDGDSSSSKAAPTTQNNTGSALGSHAQPFSSERGTSLPLSTGAEEPFDILDNDEDVFEFDEDIQVRGSGVARDSKEEEVIDDVEGEPERGNEPSLTGSSPHAGSLPIEIKWGASVRRSFKDD